MQTAGLIDLQVNGYAGVDFNDPDIDAAALDHALAAMQRSGVTTCLPTVITAPTEILSARLSALDRAVAASRLGPVMVPGFHLEGPFLNPAQGFAGCHEAAAIAPPDPAVLQRLIGGLVRPVLLLTLAPERDGAVDLIGWARTHGMAVAVGHSAAEEDVVQRAVQAGATLSTHLGNGLPQTLPKFRNPLMAQLAEDQLFASFIADGIHIPGRTLKVFIRAKGPQRTVLVTDATAAAAAPPGLYRFAGLTIEGALNGSVRVPGSGQLAGSALCLDQAIRNLVSWGIVGPETAIHCASTNPAAVIRQALRAHSISLRPATITWSAALRPFLAARRDA